MIVHGIIREIRYISVTCWTSTTKKNSLVVNTKISRPISLTLSHQYPERGQLLHDFIVPTAYEYIW